MGAPVSPGILNQRGALVLDVGCGTAANQRAGSSDVEMGLRGREIDALRLCVFNFVHNTPKAVKFWVQTDVDVVCVGGTLFRRYPAA